MKPYTEETLNALLDGEYSAEEQAELLSRLQLDDAASAELGRLRSVKQLVKTAYRELPEPEGKMRWLLSSRRPFLAVAGVALAVAFTAFLASQYPSPGTETPTRFAIIDPDGRGQQPAVMSHQETRIVLHLLDADMQVAGELLDEVENLLVQHRANGDDLRVEIVAHSDGLALLRQSLSTHKTRIARLAKEYPNLAFVACLNTMERLRVEHGVEVVLLPEARTTESGVAHVVQRQKEGWAYIKV